jgi:hypothetical protein
MAASFQFKKGRRSTGLVHRSNRRPKSKIDALGDRPVAWCAGGDRHLLQDSLSSKFRISLQQH